MPWHGEGGPLASAFGFQDFLVYFVFKGLYFVGRVDAVLENAANPGSGWEMGKRLSCRAEDSKGSFLKPWLSGPWNAGGVRNW